MTKTVAKGRANRLLRVDLTSRSSRSEKIPDELHDWWLGAKGLGAYYLAKELEPGIDPLSDENKLIFATGPYQGTGISSAGRMAVITKSPLTGIFLDSYIGGDIGHVVKRAGFALLPAFGARLIIRRHLFVNLPHQRLRRLKRRAPPGIPWQCRYPRKHRQTLRRQGLLTGNEPVL